jgi:addiction module HigA family antidote
MCFEWPYATPGPSHVEMIDYHEENCLAPPAVHPGEHLAIELKELKELKICAARLARQLDVPTNRIPEILNRKRAITGDTALHLAHFLHDCGILVEPAESLSNPDCGAKTRQVHRDTANPKTSAGFRINLPIVAEFPAPTMPD